MEIKPRLFYRVVKIQGRPRPLSYAYNGYPIQEVYMYGGKFLPPTCKIMKTYKIIM